MKILLADPHPGVKSALRLVLEHKPGASVIVEVSDLFLLFAHSAQECPDLILFDVELIRPYRFHRRHLNQPLADMINVLHKLCPCAKVVAMSSGFEAKQEALASGADGFISKTDPPEIVWESISRLREKVKMDSHDL